ncbi:hypothetical protein CZ794_13140 [Psychrobacter sp. JB385]|nr:hypothetical protein CZ794_13140 [Psychrobacter sp. JB385]
MDFSYWLFASVTEALKNLSQPHRIIFSFIMLIKNQILYHRLSS